MRISDWSSDVCSSDLYSVRARLGPILSSRGSWRRSGSAAESKSCDRPEANLSTPKRCQCSETRNSRKVSDQAMPDCNPLLWNEATVLLLFKKIDKIGRASCRERVCQYV